MKFRGSERDCIKFYNDKVPDQQLSKSIWAEETKETKRLDQLFEETNRKDQLAKLIDLYTERVVPNSAAPGSKDGKSKPGVPSLLDELPTWPPCDTTQYKNLGISLTIIKPEDWGVFLGREYNTTTILEFVDNQALIAGVMNRVLGIPGTDSNKEILEKFANLFKAFPHYAFKDWFSKLENMASNKRIQKENLVNALKTNDKKGETLQIYMLHIFCRHFDQIGEYMEVSLNLSNDAEFFRRAESEFSSCYNAYKILLGNVVINALIRRMFKYAKRIKYTVDARSNRASQNVPQFAGPDLWWRTDKLTGSGRAILFDLLRNPLSAATTSVADKKTGENKGEYSEGTPSPVAGGATERGKKNEKEREIQELKDIQPKLNVVDASVAIKETLLEKRAIQIKLQNLFKAYQGNIKSLGIKSVDVTSVLSRQTQVEEWFATWITTLSAYYQWYDTVTRDVRTKYAVPNSDEDFIVRVLPAVCTIINDLIHLPEPGEKEINEVQAARSAPKVDATTARKQEKTEPRATEKEINEVQAARGDPKVDATTAKKQEKTKPRATEEAARAMMAEAVARIKKRGRAMDGDRASEEDWEDSDDDTKASFSLGLPQLVLSRSDITGMADATGVTHDATRNIHLAVASTGGGRAIRRVKRLLPETLSNGYPALFGENPGRAFDFAMQNAIYERSRI